MTRFPIRFPIVLQKVKLLGTTAAHVSKRRAHAEGAVEIKCSGTISPMTVGHVPWPRLTDPIDEFDMTKIRGVDLRVIHFTAAAFIFLR